MSSGSGPVIGVGVVGTGFIARAHADALQRVGRTAAPPPIVPRLVAVAGRRLEAARAAAARDGFCRATADWRDLVDDDEIQLVIVATPNDLHAEPARAAVAAGKHVLCEKPLARDAGESFAVWQAVRATAVRHLCGFNYRFVPAIRLARELLDSGEIGRPLHVRAAYLKDSAIGRPASGWRHDPERAGSGVVGDLASHAVDLVRYLAGEITGVSALTRTRTPGSMVEDSLTALLELDGGATGSLEATKHAPGRRNSLRIELYGEHGAFAFDLERMGELEVSRTAEAGDRARGARRVLVSDRDHPFASLWWPPGHAIGWAETFVHQQAHLLAAIAGEQDVQPHGATFEDGYRAAEVCEALLRAAARGTREHVACRGLG